MIRLLTNDDEPANTSSSVPTSTEFLDPEREAPRPAASQPAAARSPQSVAGGTSAPIDTAITLSSKKIGE
jgi:hypothetical protein